MNYFTLQRFDDWLKKCQALIEKYYAEQYPTTLAVIFDTRLIANTGKRYIRIERTEFVKATGKTNSKSAWAFVDTTTGDILKAAGWKAPAKHARGNLGDSTGGMSQISVYGPNYLR